MNRPNVMKTILAIDPFENELKFKAATLKGLREWLSHLNISVEAVYVLPLIRGEKAPWTKKEAESALGDLVESYRLPGSVSCTVLEEASGSQRARALKLSNYAKKINASMILLTSHGRSLIARTLLGSFAVSLMMESKVPVVLLSAKQPIPPKNEKILFPTDFSELSKKAYRVLLGQLANRKAEIVLVHSSALQAYYYDYGLISFAGYLPESYWKEQNKNLAKLSAEWEQLGSDYGVRVSAIFDVASDGKLDAVEKAAKKIRPSMIALCGSHTRGLVGSLIHSRKFNVWVSGPSVTEKSKAKPRALVRVDKRGDLTEPARK